MAIDAGAVMAIAKAAFFVISIDDFKYAQAEAWIGSQRP